MTDSPDDRHIRPFGDWLIDQRAGRLHAELTDRLNELVAAVMDVGKPGNLVLTIAVGPAGKNGVTVVVADALKVKLPEHDRGDSIFFVDDDMNLVRHNPVQPRLPLREVGGHPDDGARPITDTTDITRGANDA